MFADFCNVTHLEEKINTYYHEAKDLHWIHWKPSPKDNSYRFISKAEHNSTIVLLPKSVGLIYAIAKSNPICDSEKAFLENTKSIEAIAKHIVKKFFLLN